MLIKKYITLEKNMILRMTKNNVKFISDNIYRIHNPEKMYECICSCHYNFRYNGKMMMNLIMI